MSDSVRPHRQQPTRLPHPWDSPGKNTGVGCHFLLQCRKVKSESEVAQSRPTPSDPMDCSPPGSSVHGIFQARTGVGRHWPPSNLAFSQIPMRKLLIGTDPSEPELYTSVSFGKIEEKTSPCNTSLHGCRFSSPWSADHLHNFYVEIKSWSIPCSNSLQLQVSCLLNNWLQFRGTYLVFHLTAFSSAIRVQNFWDYSSALPWNLWKV